MGQVKAALTAAKGSYRLNQRPLTAALISAAAGSPLMLPQLLANECLLLLFPVAPDRLKV